MKQFLLSLFLVITLNVNAQIPQLWGTTQLGGGMGMGTIFRINGDGSQFSHVLQMANGTSYCNLIAQGQLLLGVTVSGGPQAQGSIFSYNPFTATYNTLFTMDSITGYYPHSGLFRASSGMYYGVTTLGGANNKGTFYSFNITGNVFTKLHDFGGVNGENPEGMVMEATNGTIYGMAQLGGANQSGVIYSYDPVSGSLNIEHDFLFAEGFGPWGQLIEVPWGLLWGMTFGGGTLGYGTIFTFDPVTGDHNVVYNMDGTTGSAPTGSLVLGNGMIYGNASQGGATNEGVIFQFDPSNSQYTVLHHYIDSTGTKPYGSPIFASDNNLYGLTAFGGANTVGTIVKYETASGTFSKLHDFDLLTGCIPRGDMIEFTGPTGIDEHPGNSSGFFLYPNPSSGENLSINFGLNNSSYYRLSLYDVTGHLLYQENVNPTEPEINVNLSGGIYFANLESERGVSTQKLVVY